jgi:hypothetical protein
MTPSTAHASSPTAILRRAAYAATRAPSVHNTQPWRFVITGDELELHADRSRQLAVLDPTGRQLYISLGCALLNARVAIAAAGVGMRTALLPDPTRPSLVATLTVDPSGPVEDELVPLAPLVPKRQTNRRRFESTPVPEDVLDRLLHAAAAEGALLQRIRSDDDRITLARLTQEADRELIVDPAYRAELRRWTVSSPDVFDGVRNLTVPRVDGTAGDEIPIRDFDTRGEGWLPAQTESSTSQCLLVLGTSSEDPVSWLHAGTALERVWLELTGAGLAASLFTQPVEVPGTRVQLRSQLRLLMQPHLVMRIGYAPPVPSSPRRQLGWVLTEYPTEVAPEVRAGVKAAVRPRAASR